MQLIDGKKIAQKIEKKITKHSPTPLSQKGEVQFIGGLGVILVGNNPESRLYVKLKEKACKRVGIYFEKHLFSENSNPKKIIKKIKNLNANPKITGIIVQLPLPKDFDTDKIIQAIDPKKDVDGFHPKNKNQCKSPVLCATMAAIKSTGEKIQNKNILMISKSEIFPKPFEKCLAPIAKKFIIANSKNFQKFSKQADIIITAVGKPHYLKADMVKNGAIIIDIGISKKDKKAKGDADPKSLYKKSGWLTPTPGGIGPITVACLLKNTKIA